jgi:putative flippase GtrA
MKLNRELFFFLFVGAIATAADFLVYFSLVSLERDQNFSKCISFIVGTGVGYVGNSRITFSKSSGRAAAYFTVYAFSLIVNVWINDLVYSTSLNPPLSWLVATFSSTSINFIGLRYFVFSRKV